MIFYFSEKSTTRSKKDENIRQLSKEQLKVFFGQVIICTSLGAHWDAIPSDHPDHEDALISLSASLLPGNTIIWTEDRVFKPLGDIPASEDCAKRIFSLPMHPYFEKREIERICKIIGNEISLTELT